MNNELLTQILNICEVEQNVNLKDKTTFKIGGQVQVFAKPSTRQQLIKLLKFCTLNNIKYVILGAGSNVLCDDKNLNFIVISTLNLKQIFINEKGFVYAQSGVKLSQLATICANSSLSGLEWAVGIPGSIGGAVVMNAGAFGGEISNVVSYVDVWNGGKITRLKKEQLFFDYRHSVFTNSKKYVILGIGFLLKTDMLNEISKRIKFNIEKRRQTQNVGFPNAGSIFKKTTDLAPAFMIENAGLKGLKVGGAEVSKIHSGFIVNTSMATFDDVISLINKVQTSVYNKYNVTLQLEIILLKGD